MKKYISSMLLMGLIFASCKKNELKPVVFYESSEYYQVTDSIVDVNIGFNWCQVLYPSMALKTQNLDIDKDGVFETKIVLENNFVGGPQPCEGFNQSWCFQASDITSNRLVEFACLDVSFPIFKSIQGVESIESTGYVWKETAYLKLVDAQNNFSSQMPNLNQEKYFGFRIRSSVNCGWSYGWLKVTSDQIGFYITETAYNPNSEKAIIVGQH